MHRTDPHRAAGLIDAQCLRDFESIVVPTPYEYVLLCQRLGYSGGCRGFVCEGHRGNATIHCIGISDPLHCYPVDVEQAINQTTGQCLFVFEYQVHGGMYLLPRPRELCPVF